MLVSRQLGLLNAIGLFVYFFPHGLLNVIFFVYLLLLSRTYVHLWHGLYIIQPQYEPEPNAS